jgi:hypothetical protein
MSRDALNACITNLVQQVVDLKNMLLKPASGWDIREVAGQCKKTGLFSLFYYFECLKLYIFKFNRNEISIGMIYYDLLFFIFEFC